MKMTTITVTITMVSIQDKRKIYYCSEWNELKYGNTDVRLLSPNCQICWWCFGGVCFLLLFCETTVYCWFRRDSNQFLKLVTTLQVVAILSVYAEYRAKYGKQCRHFLLYMDQFKSLAQSHYYYDYVYCSNNKTLNACLLARVLTGCHYT
jgi:hypothetical protein